MKKIIFTCLLFLGLGITSSFAQSTKLKENAMQKVEKLNAEIIAGDKSHALTDAQKESILTIHMERLKALRTARKEGGTKEQNKVLNKKYYKKIHNEILTKEQRKARKSGKEKSKE